LVRSQEHSEAEKSDASTNLPYWVIMGIFRAFAEAGDCRGHLGIISNGQSGRERCFLSLNESEMSWRYISTQDIIQKAVLQSSRSYGIPSGEAQGPFHMTIIPEDIFYYFAGNKFALHYWAEER
jgi:hypothetical protein